MLFHAQHFWMDGRKISNASQYINRLTPGTDVSFYHYQVEDDSYRDTISPDGSLRQAAAVWTGKRPRHLLKGKNYDCKIVMPIVLLFITIKTRVSVFFIILINIFFSAKRN